MNMNSIRQRGGMSPGTLITLVIAAAVAISVGIWLGDKIEMGETEKPLKVKTSATLWPVPEPVMDFNLTTHAGTPFSQESLKGKWNIVFFGFTNCEVICPTTLALLNETWKEMGFNPLLRERTDVLFVSVDPDRDSPEAMKAYIQAINEQFIGITGDRGVVEALAKSLHASAGALPNAPEGNYQIDHSTVVFLINPRAELHAIFTGGANAPDIARDLKIIDAEYARGKGA